VLATLKIEKARLQYCAPLQQARSSSDPGTKGGLFLSHFIATVATPLFPSCEADRRKRSKRRKNIQQNPRHSLLLAGRRGWRGGAAACPHVDAELLGDGLADRSHHVGSIVVHHLLALLFDILSLQEGNASISMSSILIDESIDRSIRIFTLPSIEFSSLHKTR
jgi:hypothetical protein